MKVFSLSIGIAAANLNDFSLPSNVKGNVAAPQGKICRARPKLPVIWKKGNDFGLEITTRKTE